MVPGIVACDEGCSSRLCIICFSVANMNIRSQSDTLINLHAAIGRNFYSFIELFASRILGVSAAEHLADYCRKRFLMASLCRKEEIGMAVLAELLRVVCILILILFATAT